jgi:hypothetical protein
MKPTTLTLIVALSCAMGTKAFAISAPLPRDFQSSDFATPDNGSVTSANTDGTSEIPAGGKFHALGAGIDEVSKTKFATSIPESLPIDFRSSELAALDKEPDFSAIIDGSAALEGVSASTANVNLPAYGAQPPISNFVSSPTFGLETSTATSGLGSVAAGFSPGQVITGSWTDVPSGTATVSSVRPAAPVIPKDQTAISINQAATPITISKLVIPISKLVIPISQAVIPIDQTVSGPRSGSSDPVHVSFAGTDPTGTSVIVSNASTSSIVGFTKSVADSGKTLAFLAFGVIPLAIGVLRNKSLSRRTS